MIHEWVGIETNCSHTTQNHSYAVLFVRWDFNLQPYYYMCASHAVLTINFMLLLHLSYKASSNVVLCHKKPDHQFVLIHGVQKLLYMTMTLVDFHCWM